MKAYETTSNQTPYFRPKHLYWKAVWVGAIVAVGMTFLFNLLTIGIDLSLLKRNPNEMMALTFGTVAWMVVGSYVTLFIPGWVTGRLVNEEYSFHLGNGFLHGFVMWTIFLMINIIFLLLLSLSSSAAALKTYFLNLTSIGNLSQVQQSTEAVNQLGYLALVIFSIYFIGALGSCIGASCGIKESKRCHQARLESLK